MRQIILDTETTGRHIQDGHRLIEIGAISLKNRKIIQKDSFHTYLNPDRDSELEAYAIHGLSSEFLSDKPRFVDIASDFIKFIAGAELIIHNAPFDLSFLNQELQQLNQNYQELSHYCHVTDSLLLARKLHPNQRNSLDALCKRYEIDHSHRELHGALLDAELLAKVYLRMTSGQSSLFDGSTFSNLNKGANNQNPSNTHMFPNLPIHYANPKELKAHEAKLVDITRSAGSCLWKNEIIT